MLAFVTVILLSAGAVTGWTLLTRTGSPNAAEPAAKRLVTVGAASVTVPAEWDPASAGDAGLPDLEGQAAVFSLLPGLSADAVVVFAPDGLPVALRELIGPLGQGRTTTLAGRPGRAYEERPIGRGRIAELTVGPTPSGTLAVICVARAASWIAAEGCATQVTHVR